MIANQELQDWLGSRFAQESTRQRNIGVARAWDASPAATALRGRLDASLATVAAVRAAIAPTLADTGWVSEIMALLRHELSCDPFVQPPFRPMPNPIGDGLLLLSHRLASLSLVIVDAARLAEKKRQGAVGRSIRFSGRVMIGVPVRGTATIRRFAGDPPRPDWHAAGAPPCRPGATEQLAPGRVFEIDGRREAYTVLDAGDDLVFLQCEIACEPASLSIEYDAQTCRLLGASTTDALASRAMMMLSCLGALGATDADAAFDRGIASPHFEVRWHSLREYMAVNPATAWTAMARLAVDDPHPDIRGAAARALAGRAARAAAPAPAPAPAPAHATREAMPCHA